MTGVTSFILSVVNTLFSIFLCRRCTSPGRPAIGKLSSTRQHGSDLTSHCGQTLTERDGTQSGARLALTPEAGQVATYVWMTSDRPKSPPSCARTCCKARGSETYRMFLCPSQNEQSLRKLNLGSDSRRAAREGARQNGSRSAMLC